jgi:GT2 family glycosyltransferase
MISVITVNYKTKGYVKRMLTSLYKYHSHCSDVEVFVVENGSGDDLSDLEHEFPQVKFIYSKKNLGFAGGNNLAIKKATGEFIVLINPDIVFDDHALCNLADEMRKDPLVGIGGVSLKNLDGTQQRCVWRFPTPIDQIMLLLKVPHIFGEFGPIKRWLMTDFDYSKTQQVDQVMGAFFMIRPELIDLIGMLDEGFFMWYEEVDFARRARYAGWLTKYYANVSARHTKGSSFVNVATMKKQAMIRKSLRRYMKKHFGIPAWLLFVIPEPIYIMLAMVTSIIKRK